MAGKDAIVSTNNPQFHISRHQYDALLASHKAFRDVAIRVTDILQDPSRTSYYQSVPSEAEDEIDVSYIDYGQNVPKGDSSISSQQSKDFRTYSKRYIPHQQERKATPEEIITKFTFDSENSKARKAYRQKRQRSVNLYASTSISYLDTDYDFQCMPTL